MRQLLLSLILTATALGQSGYEPFLIAPFSTGKAIGMEPWQLPQDGFPTLKNARINKGVLEKRQGYQLFATMKHGAVAQSTTPIMGIEVYLSNGLPQLLIFDNLRVNKYDPVDSSMTDITGGSDIYSGSNADFFHSVNWLGTMYFTNNVNQIYQYTGSGDVSAFNIQVDSDPATNHVSTARFVFVKNDRLVLLDTVEHGDWISQRCRFSPVLSTDFSAAGSGYIDAPTEDRMSSAGEVGQDIVVFFQGRHTGSIWKLRTSRNLNLPFQWDKITTVDTSIAPYSAVEFNGGGRDGISVIGLNNIIWYDGFQVRNLDLAQVRDIVDDFDSTKIRLSTSHNVVQDQHILFTYTTDIGDVAYYKLDDDAASTTVAEVSGSYTGTLAGGDDTEDLNTTGKVGDAFDFDGSADYIDTGDAFQSTLRDSFSMSVWFNADDGQPATRDTFLGAADTAGDNSLVLFELLTDGTIYLTYQSEANSLLQVGSTTTFTNGAATGWQHAVITVTKEGNDATARLYLNGALEATITGTDVYMGSYTSADNLYIGAYNNNTTVEKYMDGDLDNVQIYSTALPVANVRTIYNSGSGTSTWVAPDRVLDYNIIEQSWSVYTVDAHCFGTFDDQAVPIWTKADDIYATNGALMSDMTLDSRAILNNPFPFTLMGDRSSRVFKFQTGDYDGSDDTNGKIAMEVKSARWNPFIKENRQATLNKIAFLVDNDANASFSVAFYRNSRSTADRTNTVSCDSADDGADKFWVSSSAGGTTGDFHSIKISHNERNNRPRIHAIMLLMRPGGKLNL